MAVAVRYDGNKEQRYLLAGQPRSFCQDGHLKKSWTAASQQAGVARKNYFITFYSNKLNNSVHFSRKPDNFPLDNYHYIP